MPGCITPTEEKGTEAKGNHPARARSGRDQGVLSLWSRKGSTVCESSDTTGYPIGE